MHRSISLCCQRQPHATVIGAGLVGLTSAEALTRRGFRVTILERQGGVARECSFANAALLVRSYSRPQTATPLQLLRWATSRSEPVHVSWRALADPSMASFGLRFFLAGPQRSSRVGEITQITDSLAALSSKLFEALKTSRDLQIRTIDGGLLMFFTDADKLKALVEQTRSVFSPEQASELFRTVTPQECVDLEPSLAPRAQELAGGIHWVQDRTVCPLSFSEELAASLQDGGTELRFGEEALSVRVDGGRATIRTATDLITTDAVVVAAGVHSGKLLQRLGVPSCPPVPLYGMRGHSMTLDLSHLAAGTLAPSRSVCDADVMTFFSPLPGNVPRVRVAAFGDFDGWGYGPGAVRPWRMEQLRQAVERNFPEAFSAATREGLRSKPASRAGFDSLCPAEDRATRWCGLRPMSPDGLPLVGRVSAQAPVFINAGHGALGWTLSPGCGDLLAKVVVAEVDAGAVDADSATLLRHLDPERFRWSRVAASARRQWFAGGARGKRALA